MRYRGRLPSAKFGAVPHVFALGLLFVSCSSLSCSDKPSGSVSIVIGDETDTFSRQPAPTVLVVDKIDGQGNKTEVTRSHLPADTLDLGTLPQNDIGSISVSGIDDTGKVLVHGESLLVEWGALASETLDVFAQRTGELARMPQAPPAMDATNLTMIVGRYVFETGLGTSANLYDLLSLTTLTGLPAIPRPAKSIAAVSTVALLVDEAGATTLDLDDGSGTPLNPPPGGNFGEIAGGATVLADDGSQYIVGGTRGGGGATPRVFFIDANAQPSFASLVTPREAGCATWVKGRGLVVIGGATAGAGAEVLPPGATTATPLPFPSDPVRGCAATTLDTTHVLVVGGTDPAGVPGPARVLDLGCATNCTAAPWPDVVPLVRAQAATLAPDAALVVGDDATGASHVFRVAQAGLREISLKIPRRGARLVVTPMNSVIIMGGGAGIEQYVE
jgi:hypothetical protein